MSSILVRSLARCALVLCAVQALVSFSACSSNTGKNSPVPVGSDGAAGDASSGPSTASPGTPEFSAPLPEVSEQPSEVVTEKTLTLSPLELELEVRGEPVGAQFQAMYDDGSVPEELLWSVDEPVIGSVGADGQFMAFGGVGGTVRVSVQAGAQVVSAEVRVQFELSENLAGLSPEQQRLLRDGGVGGERGIGPDDALAIVYPYADTVFPQGLAAPVLQMTGEAPEALLVRVTMTGFSYEAFVSGSAPSRAEIPAHIWEGITLSAQPEDGVQVEVSALSPSGVTGPLTQSWRIASGNLRGLFYYNTYSSPLAGDEGAVMRLRPGGTAEVVANGCTVCHSVSAMGNVLVAAAGWDGGNPESSASFDLSPSGDMTPRAESDEGRSFALGGLSPNGEWMVSSAVPAIAPWPRGLSGVFPSQVIDTTSGEPISAPSFTDSVTFAMTPAFSPDGTRLAFSNGDYGVQRGVLSVMDVALGASPPEFSQLRDVVNEPSGVVGWPSFVPDSGAVLFHHGDHFDTNLHPGLPAYAELGMVDLATGAVSELAALNGYDSSGAVYLPGGVGDARMNYEPSVLPVPVGGYYWVLFTSRRSYGNTIAEGGTVPAGGDPWGSEEHPSPRKKIWVSAIDIGYSGARDPSHPAFYLSGQELEAGNMRAFAALEPCREDGASCQSGAECCGGFCRETGRDDAGFPILQCVPPPEGSCSNVEESCASSADCCDETQLCINERCAVPPPPAPAVR